VPFQAAPLTESAAAVPLAGGDLIRPGRINRRSRRPDRKRNQYNEQVENETNFNMGVAWRKREKAWVKFNGIKKPPPYDIYRICPIGRGV